MIINKTTKGVIDRNDKPFENWTGDNEKYYLVDSRSELAKKIRSNAPYFEPITDETGQLVDITPTERPEPEPEIEEPAQDEINLDFDFRITCLELGL
jgi:hypothetical protein